MCRNNCLRSLCRIAILFFLVKRMFSSIWLVWNVAATKFSHRKQCLIATSFDIVPLAPLYLNEIFCFYLYLNIKKLVLLLNTNNLYKLQTFFLNQSHIAINLLTCLPWWLSHSPDIYHIKASFVSYILHFPGRQLYCQYVVENAFVFEMYVPSMSILIKPISVLNIYFHLTCTYYVNDSKNLSLLTFYFHPTCT